jgi:FAD/FMN-containing dehydrogenase
MIQNQQGLSIKDRSLSSMPEAMPERKAQGADRQGIWALATRLQGELLLPGDDDYAQARTVWNGAIDRHPALIVRCLNTFDVMTAITFAREHHLLVSVRSGGHSIAGFGTNDGGMVIDLSRMKDIWVDPIKRVAQVQAGLTLGAFVRQSQAYGLATTTGTVSGTGVGGLTLGGGIGWLMGTYGMTIDNLLSADLITSDGQLLTASATENPDLFWGLRGGGGNFGIVTSFEFQLHEIGPVLAGKIVYPLAKAREVLSFYRELTSIAPDELTAYAVLETTSSGVPVIVINLCYCGPFRKEYA